MLSNCTAGFGEGEITKLIVLSTVVGVNSLICVLTAGLITSHLCVVRNRNVKEKYYTQGETFDKLEILMNRTGTMTPDDTIGVKKIDPVTGQDCISISSSVANTLCQMESVTFHHIYSNYDD